MIARVLGTILLAPLAGFALEAILGTGAAEFPAAAWGRTLAIGTVAATLALAFGLPVALTLASTRSAMLRAITLLPLLVPPALAAGAWMGMGLAPPGIFGCALLLAAQSWPVAALLLHAALVRLPGGGLESARLQLGPAATLRVAVWPPLRPTVAAAGLLVFLLAASEFTVPATFAIRTVSTVLFERVGAFQFAAAAWVALPLAALAALAALALRRIPAFDVAETSDAPLGRRLRIASGLAAGAVWLATAGLPVAIFSAGVESPGKLLAVLSAHGTSLAWSVSTAALAAVLLAGWASLSPGRSALEPLWITTLVLPGTVAALGTLCLATRVGAPRAFAESGVLFVFALAARFAAVAWLPLRRPVDPRQREAALLSGLTPARAWWIVMRPALLPRAAAAAAVVFALALAEIGPSVLLAPPGRQTTVQHLFNWMHYGYDDTVASLSLALFAAAALLTGVGSYAWRRAAASVGR